MKMVCHGGGGPFVKTNIFSCSKIGNGCVFSYDPVGNYEKSKYNCAGSAGHLIQPFLDNQVIDFYCF